MLADSTEGQRKRFQPSSPGSNPGGFLPFILNRTVGKRLSHQIVDLGIAGSTPVRSAMLANSDVSWGTCAAIGTVGPWGT